MTTERTEADGYYSWGDGYTVDLELLSDEAVAQYREIENQPFLLELMKKKNYTLEEAQREALAYALKTGLMYPDQIFGFLVDGYSGDGGRAH